ncbi:MAG TPA: tetratricopeptide repeat protein [Polyangia bacterium]|nr:tetratricopeptide repeat protein [Polyangia bacterium]
MPILLFAILLLQAAATPPPPDEAAGLLSQIEKLAKAGKYDEALPLARQALALREKALGPDSPQTALCVHTLGSLLWFKGDDKSAEQLWRRALATREKALGPEHPDVAATLNNLGSMYNRRRDYGAAEPLLKRALAIREKALGPEHPLVAQTLDNLATTYKESGRLGQAEPLARRALAIREKALGKNHNEVARSLNNLGALLEEQGDYAGAEALYRRGLAIREQALGPNHPELAYLLNNLAVVLRRQADSAHAEPLYRRTLAIRERAFGPDHPAVAGSLNNLGILLGERGDYAGAEALFRRALAIYEQKLGPDAPDIAGTLDNLANLLELKGDDAAAEPLARRALAIRERKLGPQHPEVATSLDNLGGLLARQGRYADGERMLRRGLAIKEKAYGKIHPSIAQAWFNFGNLYYEQGALAKAEPLYRRALAMQERTLGPDHPDVAHTLDQLAAVAEARGHGRDALALRKRLGEIREHHLPLVLALGSEAQKLAYMATFAYETDKLISLEVRLLPHDPEAARLALETVLRRKGRVLDAMAGSLQALQHRLNASDRALLDRLAAVRAQLATRVLRGGGESSSPEELRAQVAKLESDAAALEAQVSERSAEFRLAAQPVTLAAVQAAIPEGVRLVEIVQYRPFDPRVQGEDKQWGRPHMVAYVLGKSGRPEWASLGEAAPIDQAVQTLRRALASPGGAAAARTLARELDQRVLEPVRKLLAGAQTLFVSPDGQLNLVPFEALVDSQDHYLIERYGLLYLTSGRDLLRQALREPSRAQPTLLANPNFDGERHAPAPASAPAPAPAAAARPVVVAHRSGDLSVRFTALPGTADEARALGALLPGAKVLTGEGASEPALKRLSGPTILHVATHGFFLADQDPGGASGAGGTGGRSVKVAPDRPLVIENPLLRSGLALAGANRAAAASGDDDGILTALEAAGLDLRGTRLVVLSACETGVGDVRNGEGVYGLRRALVIAGAETLVMSLWKVDDQATRNLMVDFYKRLQAGAGRAEALRQARLALLARKETAHPYYWASFILSGEPGRLDPTAR